MTFDYKSKEKIKTDFFQLPIILSMGKLINFEEIENRAFETFTRSRA